MNKKIIYGKENIINAVDKEKDGQYGIEIVGDDGQWIVKGILKDAINYSVNATWSTIGLEGIIDSIMSSNPILSTINTVLDTTNLVAGASFTNTGIFSKLFYKNSGRLSLSPTFRVFDFDGSGVCTDIANLLCSLCIPKIGDKLELDFVNKLKKPLETESQKQTQTQEANETEDATEKEKKLSVIQKSINEIKSNPVVKRTLENAETGIETIASSQANWSKAPRPITLRIGNWLEIKEAVVENVSTNFSYECTNNGPLWVDFTLTCSTIENLAIDPKTKEISQISMRSKSKSRVTIDNPGERSGRVF